MLSWAQNIIWFVYIENVGSKYIQVYMYDKLKIGMELRTASLEPYLLCIFK